jgi:cytidylate kinase
MIIAIDGPAGSGKSTIAQIVAARLGFTYLDTGAMYRAVTLLALDDGVALDDAGALGMLAEGARVSLRPAPAGPGDGEVGAPIPPRVYVGEREVTREIRTRTVTRNVSQVSAHQEVRDAMTRRQRQLAADGNVVMDGRDIGTVVCPEAEVKVYLTASLVERARRRQRQLEGQGLQADDGSIEKDMMVRDAYDSGRAVAPLRKAEDAVEVDTTNMTIAEVAAEVVRLAERASQGRAGSATCAG